jgi:hypothetical protein
MTRRDLLILPAVSAIPAITNAAAMDGNPALENTAEHNGAFTLMPGPNVEGVAFLRQCPETDRPDEKAWPPDVVAAFHQVPWIDAASVRLRWANLEPQPQEFNWAPVDNVLNEVKKYNTAHPGVQRTLQIRVMAGEHSPKWFEKAGVRFYSTRSGTRTTRVPVPYDNPVFLQNLRRLYRTIYERYAKDPLVTVFHGTWSAGPWAELFHPSAGAPLPPDYTPAKFVQGMTEQLDVLIDEYCLKGRVGELPYSGQYPPREQIDITRPLTAHIVKRLGHRNPYIYVQANGWGMNRDTGQLTISWHHDADYLDVLGQVNLSFLALGSNRGGGWLPQGDWVGLVELAQKFEIAYAEVYYADFMPLDTEHRMVQAFTQSEGATGPGAVPGFVGFRPWLKKRNRILYVRSGTVRKIFRSDRGIQSIDRLNLKAETPDQTRVSYRARMQSSGGTWSEWKDANRVTELPAGKAVEIEASLRTDDGYFSPTVTLLQPVWRSRS